MEEKLNTQTNMDSILLGTVGRLVLKETVRGQGCEPRIGHLSAGGVTRLMGPA